MTPVREGIVARVKTELEAINGTSPYTTTIEQVKRNLTSAGGVLMAAGNPGILIIDKGDEPDAVASHQERSYNMNLTLALSVTMQPGESTTATELNAFVADAIYAMTNPDNRTHNSTCLHTDHKGTTLFVVEGDSYAWALVDFQILYVNTWTAP